MRIVRGTGGRYEISLTASEMRVAHAALFYTLEADGQTVRGHELLLALVQGFEAVDDPAAPAVDLWRESGEGRQNG